MPDIFAKFLDGQTRIGDGLALTGQQKNELIHKFKRWQEGKV